MKLLVIIPAYNEQECLPAVIDALTRTCPQYDYLIVNDGSTDSTAALCRTKIYNHINLPVNLGLAGAFQAGMMYAYRHGYDAAVQFDADGQHLSEYIEMLIERLQQGYDIVIGSRFVDVKKPANLRMAGSFLISFAIRFTGGPAICDPTSGMRLFNRAMICEFASNVNYAPEPDTVCYLALNGAKISEVQVEMADRVAGTSYFNWWRSIRYMFEMAVSILLVQWFRKRRGGNAV